MERVRRSAPTPSTSSCRHRSCAPTCSASRAALPYAEAALLEPLACVLHGLSHVAPPPGRHRGAGRRRRRSRSCTCWCCAARGVERVVVVARTPARAAQARRSARQRCRRSARRRASRCSALTERRGADRRRRMHRRAERVGSRAAAGAPRRAGGALRRLSGRHRRCASTPHRLHYDQVAMTSPFHFTPRDVRAAYELLAQRRRSAAQALVTRRVSARAAGGGAGPRIAAAKVPSSPSGRRRHEGRAPLRLPRHPHRGAAGPGDRPRRGAGAGARLRHLLGRRRALVHPQEGAARVRARAGGRDRRRWGPASAASQPGDRVFVHHHAPCFRCRACARGEFVQCPTWKQSQHRSGRNGRVLSRARRSTCPATRCACPITVSDADGALVEPLACVVKSLGSRRRTSTAPPVLIIGLGVMGQLHVLLARHLGAARILGGRSGRRAAARARRAARRRCRHRCQRGAIWLDRGARAHGRGGGRDRDRRPGDGSRRIEQGLACAARGGHGGAVHGHRTGRDAARCSTFDFYFRELRLVPSYSCGPVETRRALDLIAAGVDRRPATSSPIASRSNEAARGVPRRRARQVRDQGDGALRRRAAIGATLEAAERKGAP